MTDQQTITPMKGKPFWSAFAANTIWVNISGLPRYFLVVAPMLYAAFPDKPEVAPVSVPIMALWGIWTVLFMLVTTGFYWMYFDRNGITGRNIFVSAFWVTITTIVLTWFALGNMGLAPYSLLFAATPLAFAEQVISAYIVSRFMKKV